MSTSDFFDEVDKNLGEHEKKRAEAAVEAKLNSEFLCETVVRLTPRVKEYADNALERGMKTDLHIGERVISFSLKFKDGGHRSTTLGHSMPGTDTNRIEIVGSFTNDNGQDFTSRTGTTYDHTNWKDELFLKDIEACLTDFVSRASRHGGI